MAHAQQERALRDRERRRPPAATKIQQNWRGYSHRQRIRGQWREQWDSVEGWGTSRSTSLEYGSTSECLSQLRLLAQFASTRSNEDLHRVLHFSKRYLASVQGASDVVTESYIYPASRLARSLIRVLESRKLAERSPEDIRGFVVLLTALTSISTQFLTWYSQDYYRAVNNIWRTWQEVEPMQDLVLAMLTRQDSDAYKGFSWTYLRQGGLPGFSDSIGKLAQSVNYRQLSQAISDILSRNSNLQLLEAKDKDALLWLLSWLIYFHGHPSVESGKDPIPDPYYVKVVSRLITALADDIGKRIDGFDMRSLASTVVVNGEASAPVKTLPRFVREQILSLIRQENVVGLLSSLESRERTSITDLSFSSEASDLASYVLTLLRVFPRRRNDIQLWLYRGSVKGSNASQQRIPAAKYLYQAAKTTPLFCRVRDEPRSAVHFLAPEDTLATGKFQGDYLINRRDEQWRIVLLFLELYSFILQVMDDEEFHSGTENADATLSWTRQSALPLESVRNLSSFLKKLAFALYWYPSQIAGEQEVSRPQGLAAYFGRNDESMDADGDDEPVKLEEREIAGVSGMTISSLKGLVVGVLRMIYQRE